MTDEQKKTEREITDELFDQAETEIREAIETIAFSVNIPEPEPPEICAVHGGVLDWFRVWGCEECYEPPTCSAEALIEKIDKEFVAVGRGRIDWNMYSTVPERTAMFRLKELIREFVGQTGEADGE